KVGGQGKLPLLLAGAGEGAPDRKEAADRSAGLALSPAPLNRHGDSMKALLALCLIAATPALVLAQTAAPAKAAASKPKARAKAPAKHKLAPAAQKAVEENTPIEDDPSVVITDAEREV